MKWNSMLIYNFIVFFVRILNFQLTDMIMIKIFLFLVQTLNWDNKL